MWPADFKENLLDRLLRFVWGQWVALGVPGTEPAETRWVVDPEPLLVLSLQVGRYEPRLFDEILVWLVANSGSLDASRLRSCVGQYGPDESRVVGAALQFVVRHADKRKWIGLSKQISKKKPMEFALESLFKRKQDGGPYPLVGMKEKEDPDFLNYGFDRAMLEEPKDSMSVPINASTNLRFLLRSLFGIGGRSECLTYLLTHEEGRPREIAESAGLFWLGIQQTLADMANSGLVSARRKGRGLEYWLPQKRWWDFLTGSAGSDITRPRPLNAMVIFPALSEFWRGIEAASTNAESDYLKASKAREGLERLHTKLARAGLDVPAPPAGLLSREALVRSTNQVLDMLLPTPS